jgi:ABC-2 type transport system ATP-binding protein
MVAIEATGLRKSFGPVEALRGVDLSVPEGSVCALLGPNGAGKTTAVRILATLTRPSAGAARIAGFDVVREPGRVREVIGLAGQHAAVDDDLTGRENLFILGLMQHLGRRAARARADELLHQFALADAGDRLVKTWSGGMRRRLDLIASLIVAPRVLFLDEPTTGLDPRSRAEVWSAIRDLAAAGTTILLTTQYLDEADQLAGQIVIIDSGRVTVQGTPDDLKDGIGSRVDVVLADAAPEGAWAAAEAVLHEITVTGGDVSADQHTRRLTAPVAAGAITLPELVRRLDGAGVDIADVSVRRPTLDEVFLAGTGTVAGAGAAPAGKAGARNEEEAA